MKVPLLLLLGVLASTVSSQPQTVTFRQSLDSLSTGQPIRTDSVSLTLNGGRLAMLTANVITIWPRNNATSTYIKTQSVTTSDTLGTAEISPDGSKIAAAGTGNSVHVWRLNNSTLRFQYSEKLVNSVDSTSQTVKAVTFNLQGTKLFTGSTDNSINVWNLNSSTDKFTFKQKLSGHTSPVVDLSAGSTRLASAGSQDFSVRIWLLSTISDTYSLLQIINTPGLSIVQASQLSSDEAVLAIGLQNGNVVIYNRQSTNGNYQLQQTVSAAHPGGVTAVALANDASKLATAGVDGTTGYWTRQPTTNNQGSYSLNKRLPDAASSIAIDRRHSLAVGLQSALNGQAKIYSFSTDCSQVANSNKASANGVDCGCNQGFTWYDGACQTLNCSRLPYSSGPAFDTANSCVCQGGFNFRNGVCIRNCESISNSMGITDGIDACLCLGGYEWNGLWCGFGMSVSSSITTTTTTTTTTSGSTSTSSTDTGPLNCSNVANSLGVNISPNQCLCSANFIFQNRQCFRNCSAIANSNGTNPTPDSCGCNSGYTWSVNSCVLPTTSTIITNTTTGSGGILIVTKNISTTTVNQVDCSNVPNSPRQNNGPEACRCNDGFFWNKSACFRNCTSVPSSTGKNIGISVCECVPGMIWNGTACQSSKTVQITSIVNVATVVCNTVNNSNGVNDGTNACFCNPGYFWGNDTCLRNCSQVQNSTGARSAVGNGCVCNTSFTWNGSDCITPMLVIKGITAIQNINCSDIPNSAGYSNVPGVCRCNPGYYWAVDICSINCTLVPNSLSNKGSTACNCNFGFYWTGKDCSRNTFDCNTLPNSIAFDVNNPNTCVCNNGFFWRINACYRNCAIINGSTGGNDQPDACQCLTGLVWNGKSCVSDTTVVIDCNTVANAVGSAAQGSCACASGFYWQSPFCYRNCTLVPTSTGILLTTIGPNICDCPIGRFWSNNTCMDCQIIPNTKKTSAANRCQCIDGFSWIVNLSICVRNCTGVKNSVGTNVNNLTCNCNPTYLWNGSDCILGINCSVIKYSTGPNPSNIQTCNCSTGFFWNNELRRCQQDCSSVSNSSGNAADGSCICDSAFDYSNSVCVPNCSRISYSTGDNGNGQCKCDKGYKWDNNIRNCVPTSKSNKALALGLGLGIPLGLLALAALAALGYYFCCRPTTATLPLGGQSMMIPSNNNFLTPSMNNGAVAAMPLMMKGPPMTAATLPPIGSMNTVSRTTLTGVNGVPFGQNIGMGGRTTSYFSPPPPISYMEGPVRTTQTVNTTYLNGGTVANGAFMEGGVNQIMAESPTIVRQVETIPVTTTVMDGISTTTAVPHYTVKDNLTGAHSYLNYPFGADEGV